MCARVHVAGPGRPARVAQRKASPRDHAAAIGAAASGSIAGRERSRGCPPCTGAFVPEPSAEDQVGEVSRASGSSDARRSHQPCDFPSPARGASEQGNLDPQHTTDEPILGPTSRRWRPGLRPMSRCRLPHCTRAEVPSETRGPRGAGRRRRARHRHASSAPRCRCHRRHRRPRRRACAAVPPPAGGRNPRRSDRRD